MWEKGGHRRNLLYVAELYQSPRAAVTNYHKLGGLKGQASVVSHSGSSKGLERVLPRVLLAPRRWCIVGRPWMVVPSDLHLCLHVVVLPLPSNLSLFIRTLAIRFSTHPNPAEGLPWWLRWQRVHLQCRRPGFDPWIRKIAWRRERLPTPVFWHAECHGQRNLMGYSPWGRKESDTTE